MIVLYPLSRVINKDLYKYRFYNGLIIKLTKIKWSILIMLMSYNLYFIINLIIIVYLINLIINFKINIYK
jgi:hypothetical protein